MSARKVAPTSAPATTQRVLAQKMRLERRAAAARGLISEEAVKNATPISDRPDLAKHPATQMPLTFTYANPIGSGGWLGGIEPEDDKWIAFVAMVCDHVAVFLVGPEYGVLRLIGLVAFPIFCLTFGFGLVSTINLREVSLRLLWPGVIAEAIWVFGTGRFDLNVLLVFALAAVAFDYYRTGHGLGFAFLLLLASPFLEGGVFGLAFIASGVLVMRGRYWPAIVVGLCYSLLTPSPLIVIATVLVVLSPQPSFGLPRIRGLLMWGYPAHLALLALIASQITA